MHSVVSKYSVGEVIRGCEVLDVVINGKANYLSMKCQGCGREFRATSRWLNKEMNCFCRRNNPIIERSKAQAAESMAKVAVGEVKNGRKVLAVRADPNRGSVVDCECESCGKAVTMDIADYLKGKKCFCNRFAWHKYEVGQVVAGQTIQEIHLEVGNNYAITKCPDCGVETRSSLNRLNTNRKCVCHRDDSAKTSAKKRKADLIAKVAIGDVFEGRELTGITTVKGKTHGLLYCSLCGETRSVSLAAITKGDNNACACRMNERRKESVRARYGVDFIAEVPEIIERGMKTRIEGSKANFFRSAGETEVNEFVQSLGMETCHYASGTKEIDILSKEHMIGIEYNGLYWHSEATRPNNRGHLDKKELCKKEGIDLIQLWEDQWSNRKDQVKNYLRSRFGKNENRIAVRKCRVWEVPKDEAKQFVNAHHIQEVHNFDIAFGAYFNGELIAVATFGKHHRNGEETVLSRLCSKVNWTCTGFLGKVVRMAKEHFKAPIKTWVDRCLSEGESYLKAGFALVDTLPPDYFYHKGPRRIPKQSFRKIDERTETQRAKDEGLSRVWDCGKHCFVFE
jgi:hypothetical protein